MTRREACELKLLKDGMKLEGGQIKATYPFIKQGNLSNNQGQVMSMQSSLEKRLMKTDKIEAYNNCFQDFINRSLEGDNRRRARSLGRRYKLCLTPPRF